MAVIHSYTTRLAWRGSTAAGYHNYRREHTVSAPPAEAGLRLSSDPAFLGDPALLNPEQLLVLAASSCQMLSFLAVAARARINIVEYQDSATGTMPDGKSPVWITSVVLRPEITFLGSVAEERLRHLVEVAHRECYIANTLKSEISIEPFFRNASPLS